MKSCVKLLALSFAACMGASAMAQEYRPYDLSQLKGPQNGPKNHLAVLGSAHLSQLPDSFKTDQLDPLLHKLEAWKPEMIAIEGVSGVQCDHMRRYLARYEATVERYCSDTDAARKSVGMDVPAATKAWQEMLTQWPQNPTAEDRRRLAALFLAGGEDASAFVQWLHLPKEERRAGQGLNKALVAKLNSYIGKPNESLVIAAVLAARLGLERVYSVDDHSSDHSYGNDEEAGRAINAAWDNAANKERMVKLDAHATKLGSPDAILDYYRMMNAPDQPRVVYDSDFGAALEEPSPMRYGRNYLGWWETRNLRMASNIREMFAAHPGSRALAIVGASHKGYYEDYLGRMHDMVINDIMPILQ